jgi:hypothetical protein
MAGGKKGFVVGRRPREYKETPQQQRLREASKACGITKGISRAELVDKMKTCIPQYFEDQRKKGEG